LKWLEVSISLSGELAEPVSNLFSRYVQGGVSLEYVDQGEAPINSQLVTVRAFLPADDRLSERREAIEEGLWHLGQIQKLPQANFRFIDEQDWENAWKAHYKPIRIGSRLMIQPAWLPLQEKDRLPIFMDPGMAFGTGTHPTTQLCLTAIEETVQKGRSVVDIGCGSGILSIAAAKLGANKVLALDIDSIALQNARKNIKINDVSSIVTTAQGSLDRLLEEIPSPWIPAHLVVANIITKTLEEMIFAGLGKTILPEGTLILSGILDHQVGLIQNACEAKGLQVIETRAMDDWRALVIKRIPPIN
jgi:ribosomal protein L11 methyltransferase